MALFLGVFAVSNYPCPFGYVCSELFGGLPTEYDADKISDQGDNSVSFVDAFGDPTTPFTGTLDDTTPLYETPKTSPDLSDCNCHDSTIEWRSMRLPASSSFARQITPNASDRCDFLQVGYGWSIAGYGTDPIVLTIPPGTFQQASARPPNRRFWCAESAANCFAYCMGPNHP